MIVVPHAHDQGDNAVRAARQGVARVVFPSQYRRSVVRDHISALMSEPAWERAASEVAARVRAERGAERAADALEALAGQTNLSARRAV
jgi:rhamnosyltransferase subunit B